MDENLLTKHIDDGIAADLRRAVRLGQVTQEQADRFERQLVVLGRRRS